MPMKQLDLDLRQYKLYIYMVILVKLLFILFRIFHISMRHINMREDGGRVHGAYHSVWFKRVRYKFKSCAETYKSFSLIVGRFVAGFNILQTKMQSRPYLVQCEAQVCIWTLGFFMTGIDYCNYDTFGSIICSCSQVAFQTSIL